MVRTVHMNILYEIDLQNTDPKIEFLMNTENSGFQKIEKYHFWPQNQTFETVRSSKMISKYILDHPRVILTQFPYVKMLFLMKIDEDCQTSAKNM